MSGKRPVKVLHVIHSLGVGGVETWLMEVLRHWSHTGAGHMDFLLTSGTRDVFDEEAAALGAGLHYLPYGRSHLVQFTTGLRSLLRRGAYDAIHDHADYAAGWHFLLGSGALPPVRVAHVHNPWLHIQANYATSPARRLTAATGKRLVNGLASHVCGTSSDILGCYGFVPTQDGRPIVETLHCGFAVDRFSGPREDDRERVLDEFGWPPETRLVLYAGRLDHMLEEHHPTNHKNTWLALNIVRDAAGRDPSLRMVMAGDGASRKQLQQKVADWGLADRIRLPGLRHDMPALMRAADALLFPSAQEGLGMAAVEAQAAGLPVVASQAVPKEAVVVPELFEAVPLDATRERWADVLLAAATQPRITPERCRAAMKSSPFTIAHSANRLEAIYRGSGR